MDIHGVSQWVSELFHSSGPCVVVCSALGVAALKIVVDNASFLKFKGHGVEGEIRLRPKPKK